MQDICIHGKSNFMKKCCIAHERLPAHLPHVDASVHKVQVGERLRLAIEALGLTQAAVARSLGVSPTKLGNWIRGDNYPPPLILVQLADRWNITSDWLIRGKIAGTASPLADELWKSASALEEEKSVAALRAGADGGRRKKAFASNKAP